MTHYEDRVDALARVYLKMQLEKLGVPRELLKDIHDTEKLMKLYDKTRREKE